MVIWLAASCGGRKDKAEAEAQDEIAQDETGQVASDDSVEEQAASRQASEQAAPPGVPAENRDIATPGSSDNYVLNELNFEVKKLGAEVKHLASELRDLQGKSTVWANPLTIYSKEIILNNGSTVFGKIVYQDEKIIKIETLIGYLIIDRTTVVRIVENIPAEPLAGDASLATAGSATGAGRAPSPANRVVEPSFPTGKATRPARGTSRSSFAPNIVLIGAISETKDKSGNLTLRGSVKNIGGRRADFVKVNFIFRKDWSGNTKTLTTFAEGSFHTFDSGITSEASLLPGATGEIVQYVPRSFGTYIGYSYTIDWEDY